MSLVLSNKNEARRACSCFFPTKTSVGDFALEQSKSGWAEARSKLPLLWGQTDQKHLYSAGDLRKEAMSGDNYSLRRCGLSEKVVFLLESKKVRTAYDVLRLSPIDLVQLVGVPLVRAQVRQNRAEQIRGKPQSSISDHMTNDGPLFLSLFLDCFGIDQSILRSMCLCMWWCRR